MNSTPQPTLQRGVILDLDSLGPEDLDLRALLASLPHWQQYGSTRPEQTADRVRAAQVIITNKVVIDEPVMAGAPALKLICVAATGTNNIDLQAAQRRGISVRNAVNYGTDAVAQHALMLMLTLSTQLLAYRDDIRAGRWSRSPFFCLLGHPIRQLSQQTLGIVGYGSLGQRVAELARAFGMKILVSARPGEPAQAGRLAFGELLGQVDILSLHCPLTPHTDKLINARTLALMKPGALLINTARGGLIDEPALATALRAGQLGGAGLDVLSMEPPPADHPLLAPDIPNLILTPHSAWASQPARQALVDQLQQNIIRPLTA